MLVKKQNVKDNSDWLKAFERCTDIYSYEYIKALEERTINLIRKVSARYTNICSGWIAGKDSLVLDSLLNKAGINFTPIIWRGINEYPSMKAWINNNKPKSIVEEIINKFTLEFLEKNRDYLFCQNGTRQKWMSAKWQRQRKDIQKHGFDLFIVGRRIKDGNVCGSKADDYVRKKDFATFSPLAEWNNEELLAYIKYNYIKLPPFYSYERGFLIGSIAMGEWTERAILDKTENEVWQELWDIDKSIVINASKTLTSAKNFIKLKGE